MKLQSYQDSNIDNAQIKFLFAIKRNNTLLLPISSKKLSAIEDLAMLTENDLTLDRRQLWSHLVWTDYAADTLNLNLI